MSKRERDLGRRERERAAKLSDAEARSDERPSRYFRDPTPFEREQVARKVKK